MQRKPYMKKQATVPRDGAFMAALQGYKNGEVMDELGVMLRKVTEASLLAGKTGSVTLKLVVGPSGNAIAVTPEVTAKIPQAKRQAAIFFVDGEFNLTREDPNQREMDLTVVENPAGVNVPTEQLRKVGAA